jgi:hypothetical protein
MNKPPTVYKMELRSGATQYFMIIETQEGFIHKEISFMEYQEYILMRDNHFDEKMKEGNV